MYLIAAQILVFHKRQEVVVKELNRAPLVAAQPNLVNYGTEILEKRQNIKILKHFVKYQLIDSINIYITWIFYLILVYKIVDM